MTGNKVSVTTPTGQQSYAAPAGGGGSAPVFTENPLEAGVTAVRAIHITELRTAINQVRAGVGLAGYSWQYSATTNDYISANPILELRTAVDQALGAPPSPGYAAGLAQGQPIKKDHIQELRNRVTAWWSGPGAATIYQYYDGDGLRVKKTENGAATYYLRSSVLGGQIVAEITGSGGWQRGFVYGGHGLLAVQQGGVNWIHEDPITKSKRVTNSAGAVVSTIETDPWGADTNRSSNAAFQPRKFTSYDRDANGSDEAMFRRFNRKHSRFDQPDPYDGSYNLGDPQSFNRYAYVQNDPVNFVDPTGLDVPCRNVETGQWEMCPDVDPRDTVYVYTNAPRDSLFGNYFLPASQGGHSPMVIGPLRGDPIIDITPPDPPLRRDPREAPLPPCNLTGSGEISASAVGPTGVGVTAGYQLDARGLYGTGGFVIGTPGPSVQIMGGNAPVSPGLNASLTFGSVIGVSRGANIDGARTFREAASIWWRQGSWQFGGTTPGVSLGVTRVAPLLLKDCC